MTAAPDALAALWSLDGTQQAHPLAHVRITGRDPVLPSTYAIGTAAAAVVSATTLAAAQLHAMRNHRGFEVVVDTEHAATSFRSERLLRVNGGPPPPIWDPFAGFYQCGDGRWVQLHTNFAHHRDRALEVLGVGADVAAAHRAARRWTGPDLAEAVIAAGGCAALLRTADEWRAHPQHASAAALPLLEVDRIGDAPPEPLAPHPRPLGGIRVLDLTRVIAGPVCGRMLGAYGADVLRVGATHLPTVETAVVDTGFGKRFCHLDLRRADNAAALRSLVARADIVVQSYRPGALARLGFGPEQLTAIRPGLVTVEVSAWARTGPWAKRRGYDSLVQTATGMAAREAEAFGDTTPRHLPAQALDHGTGWLTAFGAMVALGRRAAEGGGWRVRASLLQTAIWLAGLGRVDGTGLAEPDAGRLASFLAEMDSPWGRLTYVRPPGRTDAFAPAYDDPPSRPGADAPVWVT